MPHLQADLDPDHWVRSVDVALALRHTVLTAFYLLTEHFVDDFRQQKKRTNEFNGPFGPQTTKKRRQARQVEGGVSSC
jgi:hypothetical protein